VSARLVVANIFAHCAVVEELKSTIAQWQLYAAERMATSESMYTPRLRTEDISR